MEHHNNKPNNQEKYDHKFGQKSSQKTEEIKISNLRTEYRRNPIGIDIQVPRFSWNMVSTRRGAKQSAYQVMVAEQLNQLSEGPYLWRSEKINSNQSIGVEYAGPKLQSCSRYYWSVTVWDEQGQKLDAEIAFFETGLFSLDGVTGWAGAKWMTQPGEPEPAADQDRHLLKSYELSLTFRIKEKDAGIIFSYTDEEYMLVRIEPALQQAGYQMALYRGTPFGLEPYTYLWGDQYSQERGLVRQEPVILPDFNPDEQHSLKIAVDEGMPVRNIPGKIHIYLDDEQQPCFISDVPRYGGSHKGGRIGFYNPDSKAIYSKIEIIQPELERPALFGHGSTKIPRLELIRFKLDGSESFVQLGNDQEAEAILGKGYLTVQNEVILEGPLSGAPMFRKPFTTNKPIKSARLYATAGGMTQFYLNGQMVSQNYFAPGYTDYHQTFAYQTYDVSCLLNQGDNVLGLILGNGWYSGSENTSYKPYGTQPIAMVRLAIRYEDGQREDIVSDSTWQYYGLGPIIRNIIMDGQSNDARREAAIQGWSTPEYEQVWRWREKAVTIDGPNQEAQVKIMAQIGDLPQQVAILQPRSIWSDPVDAAKKIVDFGQNMVGNIRLTIPEGKAGQVIRIRFAEMLNDASGYLTGDGPTGTIYTENYRTAKSTDYYIMAGKRNEVFSPCFTFHGFRYAEITGYPGELNPDHIEGVVISSAVEETIQFESSHPDLNQLQSNIKWGMLGNFLSVPTDCPQRDERVGWTGDAQIFARTAALTMNVAPFLNKWMIDLIDTIDEQGFFSGTTAPGKTFSSTSSWWTGWSDVGVVLPYQVWQIYGDQRIITDHYHHLRRYLEYLATRTIPDGYLINTAPTEPGNFFSGFVGVGDHVSLVKTNHQLTATAYYAYVTLLMSKMAAGMGQVEDAQTYREQYDRIKAAFNEAFVQEDGTLLYQGQPEEGDTQSAYAMAITFGLIPKEKQQKSAQRLVELGYAYNQDHSLAMTTGFLGTRDLPIALSLSGRNDIAYDMILNRSYPSWLYTVEQGATTMWERWNSYTRESGFGDVSMNSFNHYAFGAVGEWMYNYMLGIQTDEQHPGFQSFILQPVVDPRAGESMDRVHWVKGAYQSVYGKIESEWKVEGDQLLYRAVVPANTNATLFLPALSPDVVLENGRKATEATGVRLLHAKEGEVVYHLQAGSYLFTTKMKRKAVIEE